METIVFDIGETLTRDDRYWGSWADWLGVPRHTVAALVGAVTAQGRDNADALRLLRPGIDLAAEYAAREAAGLGEMAELGDHAALWHDKVARAVISHRIHHTIGIGGPHTQQVITIIRDSGLDATSAEPANGLAPHIHTQLRPGDVVLVKGANALGLETVARELAAMRSQRDA
ncbi:hypothetical protein AB0J57_11300 [Streptomyces sp. NPDC049837]|uniref:hypothetical protein n=1 Tax=Streptomyces sp. NPDC049837 TaxID=3155277 RepID=UPI0034480DAE